ncbi:UNVERIFIED_ORG: hypothetical protein ABIB63_004005 [Xanthomonas axonopodis]
MRQAGEKHALLLTDRSEILASQYDGCAAAKRLQPESAFAPVLGVDATLRLKIARAVCVSCPGLQQKKGPLPLAREAAHKICGARIKGSRNVCVAGQRCCVKRAWAAAIG